MASSALGSNQQHGGNHVGGAIGPRKILPSSSIETPPSPPATETDTETETDSETPATRPETSRIDTNVPSTAGNESESASTLSPVTSPPYWLHRHSNHARTTSMASVESIPTGGITLQDNENSSIDERNHACWAQSVEVTDHVVVNGSATNIGAFVVWNVRVQTLNGSFMNIRKRYSEFDDFRWRLVRTFPNFEAAVPELPPKSLISKFRPRFLEKRRAGLQYFLKCVKSNTAQRAQPLLIVFPSCIMLNPEFSGSPVLKEFLFS